MRALASVHATILIWDYPKQCSSAKLFDTYINMCFMCNMNITLSSDKETVSKTREFARRQGMSLNQLLRRYMDSLSSVEDCESVIDAFTRNALEHGGKSPSDYKFDREEAHRR